MLILGTTVLVQKISFMAMHTTIYVNKISMPKSQRLVRKILNFDQLGGNGLNMTFSRRNQNDNIRFS